MRTPVCDLLGIEQPNEPAPPMTGTTGGIEALSMWAGQGVALARKSQPAADIVAELTSRL